MKKTTPCLVPAPIGTREDPTTVKSPVPVSFPNIGEGVVVPTSLVPGSNVKDVPNVVPKPSSGASAIFKLPEKPAI